MNTVPRAELRAFVEVLVKTGGCCKVATDAKLVAGGWNKLSKKTLGKAAHADLWSKVLGYRDKQVEVYKIKPHQQRDWFLAQTLGVADKRAAGVEPTQKAAANEWICGRAWRLNAWLLPRVRFWLEHKWPKEEAGNGPARLTKQALESQWVEKGKNLTCLKCGDAIKYYHKLEVMQTSLLTPCSNWRWWCCC